METTLEKQSNSHNYLDYTTGEIMVNEIERSPTDNCFELQVVSKEKLTHNTMILKLGMPDESWKAGLWPAGHFLFVADIDG